jgi:hypothetical protein
VFWFWFFVSCFGFIKPIYSSSIFLVFTPMTFFLVFYFHVFCLNLELNLPCDGQFIFFGILFFRLGCFCVCDLWDQSTIWIHDICASRSPNRGPETEVLSVRFQDLDRQTDRFVCFFFFRPKRTDGQADVFAFFFFFFLDFFCRIFLPFS